MKKKFGTPRPIKEVMLLDGADKGRQKAIESYYSIKKRLRGKDDDDRTTNVKIYKDSQSKFPG